MTTPEPQPLLPCHDICPPPPLPPAVRWQPGGPDQMFCGGGRAVRASGVPRGGEDCQVVEQSIFGQQIIHSYRVIQAERERSGIVKIVYLESSLAQVITVEMELNIYSQFHCYTINFNYFCHINNSNKVLVWKKSIEQTKFHSDMWI